MRLARNGLSRIEGKCLKKQRFEVDKAGTNARARECRAQKALSVSVAYERHTVHTVYLYIFVNTHTYMRIHSIGTL